METQGPALFYGIEKEGMYVGKRTLFVAGLVPIQFIKKYLDITNVNHVYFGAGGLSKFGIETVEALAELERSLHITVESNAYLPNYEDWDIFFRNHTRAVFMYWYLWIVQDKVKHFQDEVTALTGKVPSFVMLKSQVDNCVTVSWGNQEGTGREHIESTKRNISICNALLDYGDDVLLWEDTRKTQTLCHTVSTGE